MVQSVAHLLIKQHGRESILLVIQHILESREADDPIGELVWLNVFEAVLELQAKGEGRNAALH